MKILILLFLSLNLLAINPIKSIEAGGNVIDMVVEKDLLIVGTDAGSIEFYDLNSSKQTRIINFNKIKDFANEEVNAKIYSVDKLPNKDLILGVSQGESFYRNIFIIQNNKQKQIIDKSHKLMIKKAKFIDENHILIALISNELILFNLEKNKIIYRKTLSSSQFSDFSLNEKKDKVACSSESGNIMIVEVKSGKVLKTLSNGNVDNVYKVAYVKNRILSAGQDRRGIAYNLNSNSFDRYDASFLIYACALSPSSNLAALAINDQNDIAIFDLNLKKQIHMLNGQKSTLNSIVFTDENNLVSGSDDKFIMIWSLK